MNTSDPLLIVGSIAFDDLDMPTGEYRDVLGGAATYASLAASLVARSGARVVGVVGADFPEAHLGELRTRGVDTSGVERAAGPDVPLARPLLGGSREPDDPRHAAQRVRRLLAEDPRRPPGEPLRPARQHPPEPAGRRRRAGPAAEARRRRHDELLDLRRAGRPRRGAQARRPAHHQRRGGAPALRASTTWSAPRPTSASAARRCSSSSAASSARSCSTRRGRSSSRRTRSKTCSTPRARATRSPAG